MTVAHSAAVPTRPSGIIFTKFCIISGVEKTSWKGVSMTPGETALTRMPLGASSLASDLVKAVSAALDAAYSAGARTTAVVPGNRHDVDDGAAAPLDHGRRDGL